MRYFNEADKWQELLEKFSDKKKINKGIRFENLVKELLCKFFPERNIIFNPTKETHDGSKDFWAVDSENRRWWAECKNYNSNLSMKALFPTLFMADLYDIDYLLFFSYSPLNQNLLRKIGIYSNRHGKRAFIYDDVNLEYLIIKHFPDKVEDIIKTAPSMMDVSLYIKNFNEKHSRLYSTENFNGFYELDKNCELVVGEIYNIYCLVINRKGRTIAVSAETSCPDKSYYRLYGLTNISVTMDENELVMFSVKANLLKSKKNIKLPVITAKCKNDDIVEPVNDNLPEVLYNCKEGHIVPLIGTNFESIISDIHSICAENPLSGALIYGKGGCGKTRILYECIRDLMVENYKVLDFTGFDSGRNWMDVIKEITYCVFSVSEDMVLDMICTIETNTPFDHINESLENKSVYSLLSAIKKNDESRLVDLYNILFEKIRNKKYALIIDNFQSYSPMLIDFFERMTSYFLNCTRSVDVKLLFSINVELIYNNEFTEFIGNFMSLTGKNISSGFYCKEISGFNSVEQAMVFLASKLRLSKFPQYNQIKSILEGKHILNPKLLEQIADYLVTQECVVLREQKGFVPDTERLIKCMNKVPPEYERLFKFNYEKFLEIHSSQAEAFKLIFSVLYLFERIENEHIDAFELQSEPIGLLCNHGIIINCGSSQFPSYSVDHDLSFECLSTVIYNDLLKTVSLRIIDSDLTDNKRLYMPRCYLDFCRLACGKMKFDELVKTDLYHIDDLQNRHKLPFAKLYLDACLSHLEDKPPLMLNRINIMCNYVSDHIGVKTAEDLFERAYKRVKNIKHNDSEVLKELFSFYIHNAENKMHLSKYNDVLTLYKEFERVIDRIIHLDDMLKKNLLYARAYIKNRMFVCGKIENDPFKRIDMLYKSEEICNKYGFWDIQFENYFDEANLYISDPDKRQDLLLALNNGFDAFRKTTVYQKKKFMPNFLSKKLQHMCIEQDFKKALSTSEKALEYLQQNNDINYHLFFKKRYLKYRFICMIALNMTENTGQLLSQLSVIDDLSGNSDKFEIMYYYFIYSFCLNEHQQAKSHFEEMYTYAARNPEHREKYRCILTDSAIKLRSLYKSAITLDLESDQHPAFFSSTDDVLTANKKKLEQIRKSFMTTAPISTKDKINFYY